MSSAPCLPRATAGGRVAPLDADVVYVAVGAPAEPRDRRSCSVPFAVTMTGLHFLLAIFIVVYALTAQDDRPDCAHLTRVDARARFLDESRLPCETFVEIDGFACDAGGTPSCVVADLLRRDHAEHCYVGDRCYRVIHSHYYAATISVGRQPRVERCACGDEACVLDLRHRFSGHQVGYLDKRTNRIFLECGTNTAGRWRVAAVVVGSCVTFLWLLFLATKLAPQD